MTLLGIVARIKATPYKIKLTLTSLPLTKRIDYFPSYLGGNSTASCRATTHHAGSYPAEFPVELS
jgi:hypothetical protein